MQQIKWLGTARRLVAVVGLLASTPAITSGRERQLAPRTYDVEAFDAAAVENAARSGDPVELTFFGKSHVLVLEPSEVRSARFREAAGVLGDLRTVYSTPAKTFKGHLLDEPQSIVRLSRATNGLRGMIKSSEGWAFIEPVAPPGAAALTLADEEAPLHRVFTEGDIDTSFLGHCAEPVSLDEAGSASGAVSRAGSAGGTSEANLRILEVAIDADVEFFAIYGSNSTAQIESTMNMVDGIYEAELGLTIQLVSTHVWEAEPDPYTSTDSASLLNELRTYWNSNNDSISRDAVHLFTGKELDGSTVGIAYVSVVCSTSVAYALSEELQSDVLMPLLIAHEMGHNLGASHDASGSSPRYIMYPSLGFTNLDQFSALSKSDIGNYVDGVGCLALDGGGSNSSNPPGGGGGGGGGGPVDPLLLLILGGAIVARGMKGRGKPND
jgi:hypothetical protein